MEQSSASESVGSVCDVPKMNRVPKTNPSASFEETCSSFGSARSSFGSVSDEGAPVDPGHISLDLEKENPKEEPVFDPGDRDPNDSDSTARVERNLRVSGGKTYCRAPSGWRVQDFGLPPVRATQDVARDAANDVYWRDEDHEAHAKLGGCGGSKEWRGSHDAEHTIFFKGRIVWGILLMYGKGDVSCSFVLFAVVGGHFCLRRPPSCYGTIKERI